MDLYQGCWERGAEVGATIFKNFWERERFGRIFYIIHKNIYIDAYIYKSMQNGESIEKNMKT